MTRPLDISAELARLVTLSAFQGQGSRYGRSFPRLRVEWAPERRGWDGAADDDFTIRVRLHPQSDPAAIRATLLHELTHLCRQECWEHRRPFKRTFLAAANEAYGLALPDRYAALRTDELDRLVENALRRNAFGSTARAAIAPPARAAARSNRRLL